MASILSFEIMILIFEVTLSSVGYSLLAPLFPQIAHEVGINDIAIGFIFSTFAIANCIVIPFCYFLVQIIGRKRLVYLALFIEVNFISHKRLDVVFYLGFWIWLNQRTCYW